MPLPFNPDGQMPSYFGALAGGNPQLNAAQLAQKAAGGLPSQMLGAGGMQHNPFIGGLPPGLAHLMAAGRGPFAAGGPFSGGGGFPGALQHLFGGAAPTYNAVGGVATAPLGDAGMGVPRTASLGGDFGGFLPMAEGAGPAPTGGWGDAGIGVQIPAIQQLASLGGGNK